MYTVEAPPAQVEFSSMPQSKEFLVQNLAHELRQPLSTIESIAYYLELALPNADPRVVEQLTRLRHLVEQSGWILNDSLSLMQQSNPKPESVDLDELLSEFVLEQMQHDPSRPHFNLQLGSVPAWIDCQQGRELIHAICRLFRTLAKPGTEIFVETMLLSSGGIFLRTWAEGHCSDDSSLPPGAMLTTEWIEKLARENGLPLTIRLQDPSRLELSLEVPAAPQDRELLAEVERHLPALEAAERTAPTAPGIL